MSALNISLFIRLIRAERKVDLYINKSVWQPGNKRARLCCHVRLL